MNRGTLTAVYSVHCGGCSAHFTPQNGRQHKASQCAGEAKRIGWEFTRAFGWLCPLCAKDTMSVIDGTAAHLQPGKTTPEPTEAPNADR